MNSSSYHKSFFSQIPWRNYVNLMRLDRPIGWLLLLWPTWLALWGASQGRPSIKGIVVFTLGVVLMRSAGCVINDWADRGVDGQVTRTKERMIVSGKVSEKEAIFVFFFLLLMAFILVCFFKHVQHFIIVCGVVIGGNVSIYEAIYSLTTSNTRGRICLGDPNGVCIRNRVYQYFGHFALFGDRFLDDSL